MRHAEHRGVETVVGGLFQDGVEDRDEGLGPLEPEALLAQVLGAQELLERLGGVQPVQDVALVLDGELGGSAFDLLLDPALLLGLLDVHVLDAHRAAVRVAQDVEQLAERQTPCAAHCRVDADVATGEELAVQVPDGQAVGGRIQLGVHLGRLRRQRIEVGDQVAADPVHVDQRRDLHLLDDLGRVVVDRVGVLAPAHRLVGHADGTEDRLVEVVRPQQQLVDLLEQHPRLGALDDAVVVGRRDRDDLGDAELGDRVRVGTCEAGGVGERSHTDDGALARHESRHRPLGADRARVGQGHGHPGEVVDRELVGLRLADQFVVHGHEAGEVEGVGVGDARHEQRTRAVLLLHVDRDAQTDVLPAHQTWLTVGALDERVVQRRHVIGDRPHQGVADQVGEADLPPRVRPR